MAPDGYARAEMYELLRASATESLRALIAIAATAGRRGRTRVEDFLPQLLLADSPDIARS